MVATEGTEVCCNVRAAVIGVPSAPPNVTGMDTALEITRLLNEPAGIDRPGLDRALPGIYDELRRIAHRMLGRLKPGATWSTTALVNETYLKLAGRAGGYQDRAHFFAVSARAMRHILVDYARRRRADKRGGALSPDTLDDDAVAIEVQVERILAVEAALLRLADLDPRLTQVVECRVFAGYSEAETAEALGLSLRSVQRYWMRARAWLAEEMQR